MHKIGNYDFKEMEKMLYLGYEIMRENSLIEIRKAGCVRMLKKVWNLR